MNLGWTSNRLDRTVHILPLLCHLLLWFLLIGCISMPLPIPLYSFVPWHNFCSLITIFIYHYIILPMKCQNFYIIHYCYIYYTYADFFENNHAFNSAQWNRIVEFQPYLNIILLKKTADMGEPASDEIAKWAVQKVFAYSVCFFFWLISTESKFFYIE